MKDFLQDYWLVIVAGLATGFISGVLIDLWTHFTLAL